MNSQQRADYLDTFINGRCMRLLADKGTEYSRGEVDVNSNFKRVGEAIGINPVEVAYVYLAKHLDSIANYVKTFETPSGEPIDHCDGRCLVDLAG